MAEHYPNPKERIPCPKCGNRIQRDGMRRHDHSMHGGQRKRIHVCLFCSRAIPKTYSTFHDRKNHIRDTHPTCLVGGDKDPLFVEEYAAGFKLDGWYRFHGITGDELDQSFLRGRDRTPGRQPRVHRPQLACPIPREQRQIGIRRPPGQSWLTARLAGLIGGDRGGTGGG